MQFVAMRCVFRGCDGGFAVYSVPVLGGDDGRPGEGEVFVQGQPLNAPVIHASVSLRAGGHSLDGAHKMS